MIQGHVVCLFEDEHGRRKYLSNMFIYDGVDSVSDVLQAETERIPGETFIVDYVLHPPPEAATTTLDFCLR